jgi:hypothetical protein
MKRQIAGLHAADRCAADQIPDGLFLVRVQKVQFRRQAQKPYYALTLTILEPGRFSDHVISSRLYCNPKALWKFNWFLRDFGYDSNYWAATKSMKLSWRPDRCGRRSVT